MKELTRDNRINTIGAYLKERFGCRVVKLSLEGGFTCPNRDGSKGTGGCIFCSADGSGDFASNVTASGIRCAMEDQIRLLSDKWPTARYMAYFQSHTNTYAPVAELREKFEAALAAEISGAGSLPGSLNHIVGLAVATRPDCLTDEVIDYLAELNERTFLWVELGLQTMHDQTAKLINRCYDLATYEDAVRRLSAHGIRIVTHLILGLPGETKEDMLESVKYICQPISEQTHIFGLKLHLLNVIRGSRMEKDYRDYVPFSSIDEYTDLVVDALRIIPKDITIHRMTADAPRGLLIAPTWSYEKRTILNEINRKMSALDAYQGDLAE